MNKPLVISGAAVLGAVWLGPLPELARSAFWAHMTMHMSVVAVAAPLLALGLAGTRWDVAARWPRFVAPIPMSVLELVIVWGWHAPGLHHMARGSLIGLVAEQGSFLLAGLLVWISAFGGEARRDRSRAASGVVGLLLTSMHMTLLGALLALTPRPLYDHTSVVGGLTPLEDQHLGGAIMLLVGAVSYLAGGLALTVTLLRHRAERGAEER